MVLLAGGLVFWLFAAVPRLVARRERAAYRPGRGTTPAMTITGAKRMLAHSFNRPAGSDRRDCLETVARIAKVRG